MNDKNKRVEELSPLKRALLAVEEMKSKLNKLQREQSEPIAVIGMSSRFPGAENNAAYWELLKNGVDAISEIPKERWDIDQFFSSEPAKTGSIASRYGGFIDQSAQSFDASFFGISPREAIKMDPQQRLLLEVAWEALEHAALSPKQIAKSLTGVFVGICSNDYGLLQKENQGFEGLDAYFGSGNAASIAANRISYLLDLQGPSFSVDTACSSSLVSVHLACQSLRNKESNMALAGGVSVMLSPEASISFSQANMLAPGGRCRTFDSSAEGYVRSEGCGMIVLKRLSDARRDNDPILAVIRGSATNQDGRTNGLTAPNALSQKAVIEKALSFAKLKPEDISYVEAHGTGTILGDPIELQALHSVMSERPIADKCFISSAKTNIGHLEGAAGIAGLIKTILMLQNKQIPPHVHFKEINPHIPIAEMPFKIPLTLQEWQPINSKRIAGVSSFGFGGTNAHIIIQEAPNYPKVVNSSERPLQLLTLSAKSTRALKTMAQRWAQMQNIEGTTLADLCHTSHSARFNGSHRLSVVLENSNELEQVATQFAKDQEHYAAHYFNIEKSYSAKPVFMFTGQGAQYTGMASDLYKYDATFKADLDMLQERLSAENGPDILKLLFEDESNAINQTRYTQPALFMVEYALARLWMRWGVKPHYLIGHSIGEYVAATIAGVMEPFDALKLVTLRGELMYALPQDGAMLAVVANEEVVKTEIAPFAEQINIAAMNAPNNTVISGDKKDIEQIQKVLDEKQISYRTLLVSHAFHSAKMDGILDAFKKVAATIEYKTPKIPVISNLTGMFYENARTINADYWAQHLRMAVRFSEGIETLHSKGANLFLEVGPHPSLGAFVNQILEGKEMRTLASLHRKQETWRTMLYALGMCYNHGLDIDWLAYESDRTRYRMAAPTYPFQRERYWADPVEGQAMTRTIRAIPTPPEKSVKTAPTFSLEALKKLSSDAQKEAIMAQTRSAISNVLKIPAEKIEAETALSQLGMDSIMAIELKNNVERLFKIELPLSQLLQGPSLNQFAQYIAEHLKNSLSENNVTLEALPNGNFALSPGQKAMWFQHQVSASSIYNLVYAVKLSTPLNIEKFEKALQVLTERHEVLRTNFVSNNGQAEMVIRPEVNTLLEVKNVPSIEDAHFEELLKEDIKQPFNLAKDNLTRLILYIQPDGNQKLLYVAHHIISDMWSLALFMYELGTLYEGASPLPVLTQNYAAYAAQMNSRLTQDAGKADEKYWLEKLSGALPVLNFPTDYTRKAIQSYSGLTETLSISADLTQQLTQIAEQKKTTLYTLLLAAFNVLLYRYSGEEDLIIGTPTTGRTKAEYEPILGYFVNPVAIRNQLNPQKGFDVFLEQVKQTVMEALDHQTYPFNHLVEKIQPKRDASRSPIFQIMFVYQRAHLLHESGMSAAAVSEGNSIVKLGDVEMESIAIPDRIVPFDMTLLMAEVGSGLGASLQYNTDLFEQKSAQLLLKRFNLILEEIATQPKVKPDHLSIVGKDERTLIFNTWGENSQPYKRIPTIAQKFEAISEQYAERTAVVFDGVEHNYKDINKAANQLAHALIEKGVEPEDIIGIHLERSVEMIIAVLGIIKSGAAYLPLDPSYPRERLEYMVADSKAKFILNRSENPVSFGDSEAQNLDIHALLETHASMQENPTRQIETDQLCYIIYTSGSTGKPKGVMLSHAGLYNLAMAQIKEFRIDPRVRLLQFASLSFDAAASEIFTTLLSGAALYLVSADILSSGTDLLHFIRQNDITTATIPPSVLRVLQPDNIPTLETVISAGEALAGKSAELWSENRHMINAYGPTEGTVCASCYHFENITASRRIPIGKAIDNVSLFVLDKQLQPVPPGVAGELYIGGLGLARGYLAKPDLTAEKFVPNPFAHIAGERLYRSGDLVRWQHDGELIFINRLDQQVKVRGFRIELGEIEAGLKQATEVKDALVLAMGKKDKKLIAYVVPNGSVKPELAEQLKFNLKKQLPEYMVPQIVMFLEQLPVTANGKIDIKNLPKPKSEQAQFVAARNETEKQLVAIWSSVLDIENVGINDNFFDLGGHSLSIVEVQNKMQNSFKKEINVVDLFRFPTIASFAESLDKGQEMVKEAVEKTQTRASKQRAATQITQQRLRARRRN